MPKETPIVIIKNNTGADVPVPLFQYGGTPSSINATREFRYATPNNIFLNASRVSIQVRGGSSGPYLIYTASVGQLTAQGVVNALNGLNLGTSWLTKQIGGVSQIITYNNILQFGDLTIDDGDATPVNFDFDVSDAGGQIIINALVNGGTVNIVNVVPPEVSTSSQNFSVGVVLSFEITPPATTILRLRIIKQTTAGAVTLISQIVNPGDTFPYQFTVTDDALSYSVEIEQPEFWIPDQSTSSPVFGVAETHCFPENAPVPPFTLDDQVQAYIWVEVNGSGIPLWSSNVIPYPTKPDFSIGDTTNAIAQWIFDTMLAETGDAPAGNPAVDPPNVFFNGWGSAQIAIFELATFIGNAYGLGNMNVPAGTERALLVKFSKFSS